jgi:hypothetical protein
MSGVAWVTASQKGTLPELRHLVRKAGLAGHGVVWQFPNGERLHRRGGSFWLTDPQLEVEASTIVAPINTGRAIPEELAVEIRFAETTDSARRAPKFAQRTGRYPGDAPLIDEALAALKAGKVANYSQAAKLVAPRARGTSEASTIDRMRRAIKKADVAS